MNSRLVAALAALLLTSPLLAAEQEEGPWSGKATLGYLATSGNTENSNLNTGLELRYKSNGWAHEAKATAINATENELTTSEAYELGWKSEWNMTDYSFLFGRLNWRKDRFSGYDTQFSQTLGYGHRLFDTDKHKLNVEAGAGARQSTLADGSKLDEVVFRGGLQFKWLFSETAEFRQDLTVEAGDDNTYGESITAVSARLLGELALVASFTIKHNTDVPPLTENTDTYTAISLEYLF